MNKNSLFSAIFWTLILFAGVVLIWWLTHAPVVAR
jgi:hypothetical protein